MVSLARNLLTNSANPSVMVRFDSTGLACTAVPIRAMLEGTVASISVVAASDLRLVLRRHGRKALSHASASLDTRQRRSLLILCVFAAHLLLSACMLGFVTAPEFLKTWSDASMLGQKHVLGMRNNLVARTWAGKLSGNSAAVYL